MNLTNALSTFVTPYLMTKFSIKFNKILTLAALTYLLVIIPRRIAVACAGNGDTEGICSKSSI